MDKVDIMFSIPAHEKSEVLLDTIANFRHYNPNCGIVIHISSAFDWEGSMIKEEEFYRAVAEVKNVWVNPQHLKSRKDLISKLHIINFDYIQAVCEFNYFVLMASNCAFIKKGLADFLRDNNYMAAFDYFDIQKKKKWEWKICLEEKQYNKLLKAINAKGMYGGQVEGSIYAYPLFKYIAEAIRQYYNFDDITKKYQSEEIIFITAAVNRLKDINQMNLLYDDTCVYMNWHMGLRVFIVNLKTIAKKYYGVKRIPRDINADMRVYLREYWSGGGYWEDVSLFVDGLEHKSYLKLRFADAVSYLYELLKTVVKKIIFYKEFSHTDK